MLKVFMVVMVVLSCFAFVQCRKFWKRLDRSSDGDRVQAVEGDAVQRPATDGLVSSGVRSSVAPRSPVRVVFERVESMPWRDPLTGSYEGELRTNVDVYRVGEVCAHGVVSSVQRDRAFVVGFGGEKILVIAKFGVAERNGSVLPFDHVSETIPDGSTSSVLGAGAY